MDRRVRSGRALRARVESSRTENKRWGTRGGRATETPQDTRPGKSSGPPTYHCSTRRSARSIEPRQHGQVTQVPASGIGDGAEAAPVPHQLTAWHSRHALRRWPARGAALAAAASASPLYPWSRPLSESPPCALPIVIGAALLATAPWCLAVITRAGTLLERSTDLGQLGGRLGAPFRRATMHLLVLLGSPTPCAALGATGWLAQQATSSELRLRTGGRGRSARRRRRSAPAAGPPPPQVPLACRGLACRGVARAAAVLGRTRRGHAACPARTRRDSALPEVDAGGGQPLAGHVAARHVERPGG
jgi:hypothetical protein